MTQQATSHPIDSDADFELVRGRPGPFLSDIVMRLTGYREKRHVDIRQKEAASLVFPLIISFGEPFAIALGRDPSDNERFGSFAAGLYAGPVNIRSDGGACCLQIDFTPLGARRFFGMPLSLLGDSMIPLDDVLGEKGSALREQLGNEPTWHRRFALAEQFVARRIAEAEPENPSVGWAYRHIEAFGGRIPIGRLASEIGWSRKHLSSQFLAHVGATPKSVARILRFGRAMAQARASANGWADIAADCGYADQAHLNREFRTLAGETPAQWRAALA